MLLRAHSNEEAASVTGKTYVEYIVDQLPRIQGRLHIGSFGVWDFWVHVECR